MNFFKLHAAIAVTALMMVGSAQAADVSAPPYDWSGFYFGGLAGFSGTNSDADIKYGNDGGDPAVGWVDGEFHGDVYNTLASFYTEADSSYQNDPMPDLRSLATSLPDDGSTFLGTALVGYNFQHEKLVLGVELRATTFETSSAWSETSGGNKSGSASGLMEFTYTNYGSVLTPPPEEYFATRGGMLYSGDYSQSAKVSAGTEFNYLISPVARMGFAVDRVQFFAMGGPSMANVEATTSAQIDESLSGSALGSEDFTADKTYQFSGSHTENLWGYTIGGGSEWAVTDHLILRVEGEYHDLGDVTVVGKSAQTGATYKVKQDLNGYSVSTGLIWKF